MPKPAQLVNDLDAADLVAMPLADWDLWLGQLHAGPRIGAVELTALAQYCGYGPWDGLALLCSWARTPFDLDGERFVSTENFYHALKYPEHSAERRAIATGDPTTVQTLARRRGAPAFKWRGSTIEVGSGNHRALVARAIHAKLVAHPPVLTALKATARAPLQLTCSDSRRYTGVLGQVTPVALMIERHQRWGSARR